VVKKRLWIGWVWWEAWWWLEGVVAAQQRMKNAWNLIPG